MSQSNPLELIQSGTPVYLDTALVAQVTETLIKAIDFVGLREQLRARLAEIDRDYLKLSESEYKQMQDREMQSFLARDVIRSLIEKGAYDHILPIFQSYMNGSPNFISGVTDIIIARVGGGRVNY